MHLKRNAFLTIFYLFFIFDCYSQNERLADSLKSIYWQSENADTSLQLLLKISISETNPDSILKYSEILIDASVLESNFKMAHNGYLQKGNASRLLGDLDHALSSFFKSIEYAEQINYEDGVGKLYISIADVYSENNDNSNASTYYKKGIELLRNSEDSLSLATALINAGDEYFNIGKLDSALTLSKESAEIFQKINSKIGQAYSLGNIGMIYAQQGNDLQAEENMNTAIHLLQSLGEYYPIAVYLIHIADIYQNEGQIQTAINYTKRSYDLGRKFGLKEQISEASLKLSELFELTGDLSKSYKFYKTHITYRDSVKNIESVQQMANLRTNYEVSQKQIEVDLLTQQKKNQKIIVIATIIALFLICLLAYGLYRRYLFIQKTSKIIEEEKNRSEALLLNILPEETAKELKEHGKIKAKKFDLVTVLFTDFKGFTKFAEKEEPERLVKSIDFYFKAFDEITSKYGLEKIKTIGDAYMCAGGLPTVNQTHARDVIYAAIEIIKLVQAELVAKDDLIHFEIRIGVHTGPVIAGIVGIKKWQYDIWGDTVNIASRMEANSEPGKVNLSEATHNEIKGEFSCDYRGEVEVKNRGPLKMYFLS